MTGETTMALFPVQGIVEGDFVVVLVTADDADPMDAVAQAIAHHGIGTRVAAQDRPLKVRYQGKVLADTATIADTGCAPMDVLEVIYG
jgi:toluene monooxygenase system protein B